MFFQDGSNITALESHIGFLNIITKTSNSQVFVNLRLSCVLVGTTNNTNNKGKRKEKEREKEKLKL